MKILCKITDNILTDFDHKFGKYNTKIFMEWEKIVGKNISYLCVPYKIQFIYKEQCILYLKAKNNNSARLKVSFLTEELLKIINEYFLFCFISEIKLI